MRRHSARACAAIADRKIDFYIRLADYFTSSAYSYRLHVYLRGQRTLPISGEGVNPGGPQGQAAFTTPGTYSFVIPAGVNRVTVAAIGGGRNGDEVRAAGGNSSFGTLVIAGAGGGGALAFGVLWGAGREFPATNTGDVTTIP